MPITYRVDHDAGVVVALGYGVLTDADMFDYQRELSSLDGIAGYHELIDMNRVTEFPVPSADRMRGLARLAAGMDERPSRSRLAIVASGDLAFGLGRMYQAYREMDRRGSKWVGVFRTTQEALDFLQIDRAPKMPDVTEEAL